MEELQTTTTVEQQVRNLEKDIQDKKKQLAELRSKVEPKPVDNYTFQTLDEKEVSFSELFGDKNEMVLIFNMGKGCRYCTLWADGFNGLTDHLEDRAAFTVVTPNTPDVAKEFYESRGWRFNMVSDCDNTFRQDLGFRDNKGVWPAAATFTKDKNGQIHLHSSTIFGPGDNYCVQWDLMDLLPKGYDGWQPQYEYDA